MDFAGFTTEAYIAAALFLFVAGVSVFIIARGGDRVVSSPRRKALASIVPIALVASAIGLLFIPNTHVYAAEGKVITAEPHGDGSGASDYTTLDLDETNAALVIMRSDMPAVSEGDSVKLRCKSLGADRTYICKGTVSHPSTKK